MGAAQLSPVPTSGIRPQLLAYLSGFPTPASLTFLFLTLLRSPISTFWLLLMRTPLLYPLSTQTHPAGVP